MKTLSQFILISAFFLARGAQAQAEVKFEDLMRAVPAEFFDRSYDVEDGEGGVIYLKYGRTERKGFFTNACSLWVMNNEVTGKRSLVVNRDPSMLEFINDIKTEIVAEISGSSQDTVSVSRDKYHLAHFTKGETRISISKSSDGNLMVEAKSENDSIICRGVRKMEPAIPF